MGWAGALAPTLTALPAPALSLLVVASPLRRRCRGAVAPTIAAVTVTLPSHCLGAVAVTLPLRSRGRSLRVRALCSPALPHRPCRSPMASRPCQRSRRSHPRCRGGWLPCVRASRRISQPSRPPSASCPSRRCCQHRCWRRRRSRPRGGGASSSSASSVVDANAASLIPVHRAAFVAGVRLVAEAAAARPDWRRCWICRCGEAPSLSLASSVVDVTAAASSSPVRPATIIPRTSLAAKWPLPCRRHWGHRSTHTQTPLFCAIQAPCGARHVRALCGGGHCFVVGGGGFAAYARLAALTSASTVRQAAIVACACLAAEAAALLSAAAALATYARLVAIATA